MAIGLGLLLSMMTTNTQMSSKLYSTPFLPPPTTNQPSLKWTSTMPITSIKMVNKAAGFTHLLANKRMAQSTCDSLMAQAKGTPMGAKPIWFR